MRCRFAIATVNGTGPASQQLPAGFGGQSGYYTDTETGLLLLGHRYYDPGTGKFINRDPIGYQGGANLYAFCGGNPVNESDLSGADGDEEPTDAQIKLRAIKMTAIRKARGISPSRSFLLRLSTWPTQNRCQWSAREGRGKFSPYNFIFSGPAKAKILWGDDWAEGHITKAT